MTIEDMKKMQIGQVVDFCIAYNERNKKEEPEGSTPGRPKAKKFRLATQAEIDAYFG